MFFCMVRFHWIKRRIFLPKKVSLMMNFWFFRCLINPPMGFYTITLLWNQTKNTNQIERIITYFTIGRFRSWNYAEGHFCKRTGRKNQIFGDFIKRICYWYRLLTKDEKGWYPRIKISLSRNSWSVPFYIFFSDININKFKCW